MLLQSSESNGELHIDHPPTLASRLFGSVFLSFGAVCLVLIAADTYRKVEATGIGALLHASVSVLIVSVMTVVPGLLFGFQSTRIRISRDLNEIVKTVDWILFWKTRRLVADEFHRVKIRQRTETRSSRVGSSNQYQTRRVYYCDIVLTNSQGAIEVLDSVPESDQECARQIASGIAEYLQIPCDQ